MHNLIFSVESLESCSTDDYIIHCAVKGLNYGKLEVHVRPCIFFYELFVFTDSYNFNDILCYISNKSIYKKTYTFKCLYLLTYRGLWPTLHNP